MPDPTPIPPEGEGPSRLPVQPADAADRTPRGTDDAPRPGDDDFVPAGTHAA